MVYDDKPLPAMVATNAVLFPDLLALPLIQSPVGVSGKAMESGPET